MRSIVVLPFSDLSANRDQEYFCDGITEELTEALVRIQGLRVVSFTTALRWKHRAEDVREIGKRLNVGLVLEGSVRKDGRRLRIVAQLINADNGYHIWSRTYDRELADIFKVQQEIANGVVSANWKTLTGHPPPAQTRATANLEAYDFYLRGLHAAQQWTTQGLTGAVAQFHRAIDADPGYAAAYAALAEYYTLLGVHAGLAPAEAMPKAKAAALKALELDSSLAHAHAALALVNSVYEWDWDEAERGFRRALELDPTDDDQRQMYVMGYLIPKGRLDEAISQMEMVRSHDPISTRAQSILGMIYYFQRDYDRAIQQYRISLSLDPHDQATKLALGSAYAQNAQFADAVVALQEGRGVWSAGMGSSMMGHAYALMGRKAEAEKILREVIQLSAVKYISPVYVAAIYAGLGDREHTLTWLEKAYGVRAASLVFLKVNPRFDLVRSDARFKDLLGRMRLE